MMCSTRLMRRFPGPGQAVPVLLPGGGVDRGGAVPRREMTAAREAGHVTNVAEEPRRAGRADAVQRELVQATGSTLLELNGVGPSGSARLLGDIGDVSRFPSRGHFASWNGTAPIDASSGEQNRHRLSRSGNRRINRVLHIMAIVQLRNDTEGRAYYRRKLAAGKTPMEAIRALKRRLSDIVYRQLVNDQKRRRRPVEEADPGGQAGASTGGSSAAGFNPDAGASEKSLPGPAGADSTPTAADHPDQSSNRSRRPRQAPTRSRRQAQSA